MRFLALAFVTVALAQPLGPYSGDWTAEFNGTPYLRLTLHDKDGAPQGAMSMCTSLQIDKQGNVFATGPGGVWVFNSDGKVLGKIKISELTSNCALSPDEKTLYVTADRYVLRIKLRD